MYTYRRGSHLPGSHAADKRRQRIKQHRRALTNVDLRLPRMQLVCGVQVELHQRLSRQAENVFDPGEAPRRHTAHGLPPAHVLSLLDAAVSRCGAHQGASHALRPCRHAWHAWPLAS